MRSSKLTQAGKFLKFLLLYVFLVGVFLLLLSMLYKTELHKVDTTLIGSASSQVSSAEKVIKSSLRWRVSDLSFFERTLIRADTDKSGHLNTDKITLLWRSFIQSRRVYTEVKWVDFSGQEKIKINYNQGKVSVAQPERLMNISQTSYFKDIMKFPRKKIFISALDMEMKESINSIYDAPVLVIGEKIENIPESRHLKGLLIISYKIDDLLNRIYDINDHLWLSNNTGQWVKVASEGTSERKHQLKYQIKMSSDYVREWGKISVGKSGSFIQENGIWVFNTLLTPEQSGKLGVTRFYVGASESQSPRYPWKIIYYISKDDLNFMKKEIHHYHIAMISFFSFLFLLFGYYIFSLYFKSQKTLTKLSMASQIIDNHVIYATSDLDDCIESVSEAFCAVSGYTQEELLDKPYTIVRHPDMSDSFYIDMKDNILSGKSWSGEIKNQNKNGETYWVFAYIDPNYSSNGHLIGYTAVEQNITDRKHVEKLSVTDRLTGMHNRLKLDETLEREMFRAERYRHPLSIILLDIDNFKMVNDNYGHRVGDDILCKIAELLQCHVRKTDIPGRWGGEEFLIVCPETDFHGVQILAEKLRQLFMHYEFEVIGRCTCSFGVVTRMDTETVDQMMERADIALYLAKDKGKNRVESI
ncbi:sensor domain-containing diguanylate cyclase [Vibrio mangrovi]|uniref:diguanylate cyclase n=1 Tax=Vibrio mangrovi TaxID=474394 RepID=A0A1Y6ITL4_9VIBR|nr:sensor domain-containing diguanylate cyclase [Vibrio mangrovi]MDW6004683.1 sensor domain-containing diguanylate cyclase [Vibrio mangrovi]SMS00974.1 Response regulator PleD [Vibrio mangrovi]